MLPLPAKQTKPRPVTVVRPQCAWLCLGQCCPEVTLDDLPTTNRRVAVAKEYGRSMLVVRFAG